MNFFEAQARARRRTGWLLVLFALAVASLVVLTNLLVMTVLAGNHGAYQFLSTSMLENFDWGLFGTVTVGTLIVIGGGSAYKMSELSGGGRVVAEMLGGRLVPRNSADPAERRLLNVVEEMAIAAGTPVPPVYLLDDDSINAFAAGLTSNDAVVAVTRGTLDLLNRDELQGVIAHEFSHIFNGDMRMNIRLMGVLHGILLIGLTGYYLLRSTRFIGRSRSSRGAGNIGLAMVVFGLGLVVIGYAGFFFGQWIKATVSRQREYLADASAVQFTRNRDGIGGALKKIGGTFRGSLLQSPAAREYSHAYFSSGVEGFLDSLFATHPPLEQRIRRIEPRWDGKFVTPKPPQVADDDAAATRARDARRAVVATAVLAGVLTPDEAVATIGNLDRKHVDRARDILDAIPAPLRDAAAEPFGARAVVYAMLLDAAPAAADVRSRQQAVLATQADAAVAQLTATLDQHLPALPEAARLPLAGLAMPTLRTLSSPQYERFRTVVAALIEADNKMSMNEWMLRHFLMRQLDEHFGLRPRAKSAHGLLGDVNREAGLVISLVAHAEHTNAAEAELAFKAGIAAVGATALKFVPREQVSLKGLDEAVDRLAELKPLLKPRILKACAATIMHDGEATIRGQELLRTLASSMDSPMPPLAN